MSCCQQPLHREQSIHLDGSREFSQWKRHYAESLPVQVRAKYLLYDNKICTGDEAAECVNCMKRRMESVGYHVVVDRGDHRK